MKTFYTCLWLFALGFLSCETPSRKERNPEPSSQKRKQANIQERPPEADVRYEGKIDTSGYYKEYNPGEFKCFAAKNTTFELLKIGEVADTCIDCDTIYQDHRLVLLGQKEYMYEDFYQQINDTFNLDHYKVKKLFNGYLAPPDFSTNQEAKWFKTRIKDACRLEGINIAGHYTLCEWGCGADCRLSAIVDRITGKIYFPPPYDTIVEGHNPLDFHPDYSLIYANMDEDATYPGYRLHHWRPILVYNMQHGEFERSK